jgi:hypothetical protein
MKAPLAGRLTLQPTANAYTPEASAKLEAQRMKPFHSASVIERMRAVAEGTEAL